MENLESVRKRERIAHGSLGADGGIETAARPDLGRSDALVLGKLAILERVQGAQRIQQPGTRFAVMSEGDIDLHVSELERFPTLDHDCLLARNTLGDHLLNRNRIAN